MSKRVAPPVKSSTPTRRTLVAAVGFIRKSGVIVVPIEHAVKPRAARLRLSAIKVSKQIQGWG
jgi:hypothetical protein